MASGCVDIQNAQELTTDWESLDEFDDHGSIEIATPLMYVPSVGRGFRKRPDPCDIRLPRFYYDKLRHQNLSNSNRPAGRGKVLAAFSSQNPPGRITTQDNTGTANQRLPPRSLPLDENFLGAATRGLTSEILEGKACIMEKFLGKAVGGQEAFNPFGGDRPHASNSLRSAQTAPTMNLHSREQWPDIGGNGGACRSDCGLRGTEGTSYSSRSIKLEEALKVISSLSNGDRSSLDGSMRGSGGSRNRRRLKKKQASSAEDSSQEKESTRTSASAGAVAPPVAEASHPMKESGDKALSDDLTRANRNQQGAIPGGPNLIQVECLPEDITEQRLTAVMYGFGPVISCKILKDSDSQKCIGIAFVRFETSEACLSAISSLHMENSPFHDSSDSEKVPKLLIHMVT